MELGVSKKFEKTKPIEFANQTDKFSLVFSVAFDLIQILVPRAKPNRIELSKYNIHSYNMNVYILYVYNVIINYKHK